MRSLRRLLLLLLRWEVGGGVGGDGEADKDRDATARAEDDGSPPVSRGAQGEPLLGDLPAPGVPRNSCQNAKVINCWTDVDRYKGWTVFSASCLSRF